ncbi:unnamed protein product [Rangifer tarandus platyrhynchus]|uniref:Uncharacterized protein n=1 Tax=Rangifer tarandus platyrhynchus TaxID=3082113 RepID=A0ABN8ZJ97_RANTA|nr:unnamed protein product [Rangifer tarandus platyrhynchus]
MPFFSVSFHWWSMSGQWLFLALASVLLIRKHLLIIAGSFSLVLFKVEIAFLCFLIMKLTDTRGENSNNTDKCKVGSTQPQPPETALLTLPCISFGRASHLNVEWYHHFLLFEDIISSEVQYKFNWPYPSMTWMDLDHNC